MSRPLIKCDCSECSCELPTDQGVCYYCGLGQHRTRRVKELERDLDKANAKIAQLEKMKSIEWKN